MYSTGTDFLQTAIRRLKYYKDLGEKALLQLAEKDFLYKPGPESNSIAVIIQHLSGNMLSRWTNFLQEDGEKDWRNRDEEFADIAYTRTQLLEKWEAGWYCFLTALESLQEDDLSKTVYIRKEALSVPDAINRQLAHYPYHIGQLIFLARMLKKENWQSLSIAPRQSEQYNQSTAVKDPAKKF